MTTLFGLDVAGVLASNWTIVALSLAIVIAIVLMLPLFFTVEDEKKVAEEPKQQAASQGKAAPAKAGKQLTPYQVARRACVRVETSKFGFAERQAKNDWLDWTYGGQQIVGSFR